MKYMNKAIMMLLLSAFSLTSCIDEVEPTSGATQEQLSSSTKALEAILWGMPAYFNEEGADAYGHYAFGYGAQMHIRDVMTGDMPVVESGYDHFSPWEENKTQGDLYRIAQYIWNYYYHFVLTANKMIAAVDTTTATKEQLGYLGAGYAFRALIYLDMARQYEYLPNDVTSIDSLVGLTVPINTEKTTEKEAKNNPRATRQQMAEFIESDLKLAEKYIENLKLADKTLPHLNCVYGLYARLYMWLEDYPRAAQYAQAAISKSGSPMSEADCLDIATGFNTLSKWMWGSQMVEEDAVVQTGIINWTSWMANETNFGYAGAGPMLMIDRSMYDRMSDTDFRKRMYKAPKGSPLEGSVPFIDENFANNMPDYASVKFRPKNGKAGMDVYTVGAVTAYPVMRVEEMWFIYAEAVAHSNPSQGLDILTRFMKTYRDPKYYTEVSTAEEIIDEIVFQKRVELWGEGQTFFDIKRLNMPVTRAYAGTNWQRKDALLNTTTRPAWMNTVIVRTEQNNNAALVGHNNPDPSGCYLPVILPEE